jgi:hypothetical protein
MVALLVLVRFLAGRKTCQEQIKELPVSFTDRCRVHMDKAAQGGWRIKEGCELRRFCQRQD